MGKECDGDLFAVEFGCIGGPLTFGYSFVPANCGALFGFGKEKLSVLVHRLEKTEAQPEVMAAGDGRLFHARRSTQRRPPVEQRRSGTVWRGNCDVTLFNGDRLFVRLDPGDFRFYCAGGFVDTGRDGIGPLGCRFYPLPVLTKSHIRRY